jgi:lipoprotein
MRRKALVLCLLLIFTCFLSSCGKASGEENPTVIKSDLTIEALRDILVEKGDDIRFSDIPEEYFYVISSTLVPQLRYPINDELSFYIMQLSEDKFSVILTVRSEDGEMDFTGAEEILAYIESIED